MSESADPRLLALRDHCMAFGEGVTEEYPWGHPVWKVNGKMFAASSNDGSNVSVKATLEQQSVLIQHRAIRVADYVGRHGWVSVTISDQETLDLTFDLIDESFEMVTPKRRKTSKAD